MGRTPLLSFAVPLLLFLLASPAVPGEDPAPPLRAVVLDAPGEGSSAASLLPFASALGFNAAWIETAPIPGGGDRDLLALCRIASELGLRTIVEIRPLSDPGFSWDRRRHVARLRSRIRTLERTPCVSHVVLSFRGAPEVHLELRDAVTWGRNAAPAHLRLLRDVRRAAHGLDGFWVLPSDGAVEAPRAYAEAFLDGLRALPPSIGLVWDGGGSPAAVVAGPDLDRILARSGARPVLLFDRYPSSGVPDPQGTAVPLGPLRGRDPAIRHRLSGYAADARGFEDAARLPLLSVARWFADDRYEPARAMRAAAERVTADDAARRALLVQAEEWGGWVDEIDFVPADGPTPEGMAERLAEPAYVSSLEWITRRYPERMARLSRISDVPFRMELLRVMERRFRIAAAAPLCVEFLARARAGRDDAQAVLDQIEKQRRSAAAVSEDALRALDRFLRAAQVPLGGDAALDEVGRR